MLDNIIGEFFRGDAQLVSQFFQHETIGLMKHEPVHLVQTGRRRGQQIVDQRRDLILDKIEYRDSVHVVVFLATVVTVTGQRDLCGFGRAWQAEASGGNHDLFVLIAIHLQICVNSRRFCGWFQDGHRGGISQ